MNTDNETEIINEFNKIQVGELLPREGACQFFYNSFYDAGQTRVLCGRDQYALFYIENDDAIQELLAGDISVFIENDEGRTSLYIIFKTGAVMNKAVLIFNMHLSGSAEVLSQIKNNKEIRLHLLNFVYGGIVKEKTLIIPLTGAVLNEWPMI